MDDENFDLRTSEYDDYLPPERRVSRRSRRERGEHHIPARYVAFVIGVNAVLSLIISLVVVNLASPKPAPVGPPPLAARSTETAVAQAAQAQPVNVASPAQVPARPSPAPMTPTPVVDMVEVTEPPPPTQPPEPISYIVQPGDTLSTIAARFDVSLDDLMKANGIDNPDYLMLGQELIIPIGGMPIMTPTFTPLPIPTVTPIPFEPPTPLPPGTTPQAVPLAEVAPSPTAVPTLTPVPVSDVRLTLEVLSPGDPVKEMVYVVNRGLYVRLVGWTLSNERGDTYTFPDLGLGPNGAAVAIHTGSGPDSTTDLYWGRSATAWRAGDVATLRNTEGKVMATQTVGTP
jgi:LysM repeat protein